MIKQMLEFVDIDNQRQTRTVMFNLTKFEVEGEMELEIIQERFQRFQDEVIGNDPNAPIREMTGPEKREMLAIIKTLVRHAYGIKDGKRFKKSDEIWAEFEETGAFSAFIYWLFEKPERANAFMSGIWPQGIDRPDDPDNPQPSPDLKVVSGELIEVGQTIEEAPDALSSLPDISETPHAGSWEVKENLWDYSQKELLLMSDAEFEAVQRKFTQGRNVPLPLLQIAGKRQSQREGGTATD